VDSVLRPFGTTPIKPFYDYPLNTVLVEQTLEIPVQLLAQTGTGEF
jgi:hypothetical protein